MRSLFGEQKLKSQGILTKIHGKCVLLKNAEFLKTFFTAKHLRNSPSFVSDLLVAIYHGFYLSLMASDSEYGLMCLLLFILIFKVSSQFFCPFVI